jgi:hypothetical protein
MFGGCPGEWLVNDVSCQQEVLRIATALQYMSGSTHENRTNGGL